MIDFTGCSEIVQSFALMGMTFLYLLIGLALVSLLFGIFKIDDDELVFVLGILAWPFVLVAPALYAIGVWILVPIWAATKTDLRDTERRLSNKIDKNDKEYVDFSDVKAGSSNSPFKIGDIITGIVPQTDRDGDKMSYNTLYQGCRCRVQDIDSDGDMELLLIGHKDKDANKEMIGEIFEEIPARNFTLVKKTNSKKKVVKKSKR